MPGILTCGPTQTDCGSANVLAVYLPKPPPLLVLAQGAEGKYIDLIEGYFSQVAVIEWV